LSIIRKISQTEENLEQKDRKLNIVLTARERKKELMVRFCIAYRNIITCHNLFVTSEVSRAIEKLDLNLTVLLNGILGGYHQIFSKISCGEIDIVFFFRDTGKNWYSNQSELELLRNCDFYNIPVATNLATAEILIDRIADKSLGCVLTNNNTKRRELDEFFY
jgi:methylglyoxal synthase